MTYTVKEIYFTLQGEGAQTGRAAVFCRFSGCNLWSGLERDRASAVCRFCDTDFVGQDGRRGGKYSSADELADAILECGARARGAAALSEPYFAVLTGGEPMLQVDAVLVAALHERGFEVAIETNGTLPVEASIDWICVSPKAGAALIQRSGHELKLVYPQKGVSPENFESLDFQHFYLQPMDCADREKNTRAAIEYCARHPKWRLSLQTHKYLGID